MARFSRRALLKGLGVGAGTVAASRFGLLSDAVRSASALTAGPFSRPLKMPPVLTDAHVTLTAAPSSVQILPGAKTKLWTFNGAFPGPIIRRPSGTPTRVTILNRL